MRCNGQWRRGAGGGEGKDQGEKTLEKNLDVALRDVINYGATIFNTQGDYAGCYRVFEGSLRTVQPLLGKYPDLQKKIEAGLTDANQKPSMHDPARSLRKVLDEVRLALNPTLAKQIAKTTSDVKTDAKKAPEIKSEMLPDVGVCRAKGDVKVGGKKLTQGFVTFVNATGQRFSANVQKDGTFAFSKGFPIGEYIVVLDDATSPPPAGETRLDVPGTLQERGHLAFTLHRKEGRNHLPPRGGRQVNGPWQVNNLPALVDTGELSVSPCRLIRQLCYHQHRGNPTPFSPGS